MNTFRKILNKKQRGFTLIELIVVIAIIAILLAVAIPSIAGFVSKAKDSAKEQTANLALKAWQMFEAANEGTDPTLIQINDLIDKDLTALPTVTQDTNGYVLTLTYDGVTVP